ncbi:hypothetical protein B0H19DRAFT_1152092 [Mycena capillaripes]|nr:hypothetical protein B0H19DRAFT_1152092 [Mycena capillaripes]
MDGLLIFGALFSVIVTFFIIESYKTLKSDLGEQTVQLLVQISQQLSLSANGSTVQVPSSAAFQPSTQATLCNVFWLISLSFSLACALFTTLVQQWAREFLHKSSIHSAPEMRARIFSFLYYGLKRFHMQTVVDTVPLLLHISLLFFLAGLVMFLIPVHNLMAFISAGILFVFTAVYGILTILPLWSLDCPYSTPLSRLCWGMLTGLKKIRDYQSWPGGAAGATNEYPHSAGHEDLKEFSDQESFVSGTDETMVNAMARNALQASPERDRKALSWTVKSLTDNVELEAFVDAIPDLLWGPHQRRYGFENHIQHLVRHPETQLLNRIVTLMNSCNTGCWSLKDCHKCRIICYRALWAIASLAKPIATEFPNDSHITSPSQGSFSKYITPVDFSAICKHLYHGYTLHKEDPIAPYFISAAAMMEWSTFCAVTGQLLQLRHRLNVYALDVADSSTPDLPQAWSLVRAAFAKLSVSGMDHIISIYPESGSNQVAQLHQHIDALLLPLPFAILSRYFTLSADLSSSPDRWDETWTTISVDLDCSVFVDEFDSCLEKLMNTAQTAPYLPNIREIISALLSLWRPRKTTLIPGAIIRLLNQRSPESGLRDVLRTTGEIETHLWTQFPPTLMDSHNNWSGEQREKLLTALWCLALLYGDARAHSYLDSLQSTLEALKSILKIAPQHSQIISSITLVLKFRIVSAQFVPDNGTIGEALASCIDPIFPTNSATTIPDHVLRANADDRVLAVHWLALYECMACRKDEARIIFVAEFLEQCNSEKLPYEAAETIAKIAMKPSKGPIHENHQIRFATSVYTIFTTGRITALLNAIINCGCWDLYAAGPNSKDHLEWAESALADGSWPWLDHHVARETIRETFAEYADELRASTGSPDILIRLQNILAGLDSWHPTIDGMEKVSSGGVGVEEEQPAK